MIIDASTDTKPGEFTVEISDFGPRFRIQERLVLPLNGSEAHLKLVHVERDADNDVRWWQYREEAGQKRSLKIFND